MTLIAGCTVRVQKAATTSFTQAMQAHRIWLDAHKIQPVLFKLDDRASPGTIYFEISFQNEVEATAFDTEFGAC